LRIFKFDSQVLKIQINQIVSSDHVVIRSCDILIGQFLISTETRKFEFSECNFLLFSLLIVTSPLTVFSKLKAAFAKKSSNSTITSAEDAAAADASADARRRCRRRADRLG
jgi:hypothetical protein